ncbi:craniofacial development protein 2-like [Bolinopsis microptera]|uniref:craniofacial development protein 2-like n=1 Tax=Bolinopsis microptera TaxID=2820187 RepID=UPI00307A7F0A
MTHDNSTRVQAPNYSVAASSLYDGPSLKPSGGVGPDSCSNPVTTLLVRRKTPFQVSTFNCRTLNPVSRKQELAHSAFLHHNDVISLQEHRQHHKESLRIENILSYQLITASATKNSVNASVGGVGFLLSPRIQKSLLSVEKVNSRIILLHVNGNPRLTVLSCYAPTNCSDIEDKTAFYNALTRIISKVPPHNMLAVCGDFNAKLSNSYGFTYHQSTNDNGERLLDLVDQHQLIVANRCFQKPANKIWTYEDPKRAKH